MDTSRTGSAKLYGGNSRTDAGAQLSPGALPKPNSQRLGWRTRWRESESSPVTFVHVSDCVSYALTSSNM